MAKLVATFNRVELEGLLTEALRKEGLELVSVSFKVGASGDVIGAEIEVAQAYLKSWNHKSLK